MGIWWESITDRGPLTPDILRDTDATEEDIPVHQQRRHTTHPDGPCRRGSSKLPTTEQGEGGVHQPGTQQVTMWC